MIVRTGLGQDSHAFEPEGSDKPLVLGGVVFGGTPGLRGHSDADAVLHAIVNALSGLSGVPVLGPVTDELCREGVTDSAAYVREALGTLGDLRLTHVSVSIECSRPRILPRLAEMRATIAELLGLTEADVAVTATSGEGLTAFGRGEGVQALAIATAQGRA